MSSQHNYIGEVIDLFCGAGGLSFGLASTGFRIVAGYDFDDNCRYAFETNTGASFYKRDISELSHSEVLCHFSGNLPTVLAGCAPCQPFSTYKMRYGEDFRWKLLHNFASLAAKVQPDIVTMENVASLINYKGGVIFNDFCASLSNAGYSIEYSIAACENFGVPQSRKRLVLVASSHGTPSTLKQTHDSALTVRSAIGHLPSIEHGTSNSADPLHRSSKLSDLNLLRIRSSRPGGTWRDWSPNLRALCHRRKSGKTYTSVYSRMEWDRPAPTITTQCFGFGNGRFGHPEQDRAISLREAALLQSFPARYQFIKPNENPAFKEVGRWIGNAVPVNLAIAIGRQIRASIGV